MRARAPALWASDLAAKPSRQVATPHRGSAPGLRRSYGVPQHRPLRHRVVELCTSTVDSGEPAPPTSASALLPRWLPDAPDLRGAPPRSWSPAALAFLGDAIWELYARRFYFAPARLHATYVSKVSSATRAEAQAAVVNALSNSGHLTEMERGIVKWGRNAQTGKVPERLRANGKLYREATALESEKRMPTPTPESRPALMITVPPMAASQKNGLRDALALAILEAKQSAQAETARWKQRCADLEVEANQLRSEALAQLGLLGSDPPASDMDILDAVIRRTGGQPCEIDTAARYDTHFWRQVRMVQTVRQGAAVRAAHAAGAAAPTLDIIAFLVDVVASAQQAERPKFVTAFIDSALSFLSSAPARSIDGHPQPLYEACNALCDIVLGFRRLDGTAPPRGDPRPCVQSVMCRLVRQPIAGAIAAVLNASAPRLSICVDKCAAVAIAESAAHFDVQSSSPDAQKDAQQSYDNAYFLFAIAEQSLEVLGSQVVTGHAGNASATSDAAATLESFAHVHANCQRKVDSLCPRFAVLAAAVWRLTAAANTIALRMLQAS